MSATFDAYAAYYDLLYRDKDYPGEVEYVDGLIQAHNPRARTVLELGCGTGGHAVHLARRGYRVVGVDLSAAMIEKARARAAQDPVLRGGCSFVTGDLRDHRANEKFDVVAALFHVMSYQTSNPDLQSAMRTAAVHLRPGGLFVFDCWYGPGVLRDLPTTRIRRFEGEDFSAVRLAEPAMRIAENVVDVHYEVLIEREGRTHRINEVHSMRYLFEPEVDLLLEGSGLRRIACTAWMEDAAPSLRTWNACFVATL